MHNRRRLPSRRGVPQRIGEQMRHIDAVHVLSTLSLSHDVEKARWALTRYDVQYRERPEPGSAELSGRRLQTYFYERV